MSTLLLELVGHRELNHTIWPPHLYIYDDLIIFKKRRFFKVYEITVSYSHIVRINLHKGLLFASLELVTSADENIIIKYVGKNKAAKAKKIIDQKIYTALAKHNVESVKSIHPSYEYEKALHRLKELYAKGRITKKEYSARKADLLKKLR